MAEHYHYFVSYSDDLVGVCGGDFPVPWRIETMGDVNELIRSLAQITEGAVVLHGFSLLRECTEEECNPPSNESRCTAAYCWPGHCEYSKNGVWPTAGEVDKQ